MGGWGTHPSINNLFSYKPFIKHHYGKRKNTTKPLKKHFKTTEKQQTQNTNIRIRSVLTHFTKEFSDFPSTIWDPPAPMALSKLSTKGSKKGEAQLVSPRAKLGGSGVQKQK